MAQTAVEKILAAHAGRPVRAGDLAIVDVDLVMATDGNAPLAIRLLRHELAGVGAVDGSKIVLVIDHCAPALQSLACPSWSHTCAFHQAAIPELSGLPR